MQSFANFHHCTIFDFMNDTVIYSVDRPTAGLSKVSKNLLKHSGTNLLVHAVKFHQWLTEASEVLVSSQSGSVGLGVIRPPQPSYLWLQVASSAYCVIKTMAILSEEICATPVLLGESVRWKCSADVPPGTELLLERYLPTSTPT